MSKTRIITPSGEEHTIDGDWDTMVVVYFTKKEIEEELGDTLTIGEWFQIRDFLDSRIRLRQSDVWEAETLLREIRYVPVKYRKQGQAKNKNTNSCK